MNRRNFLASAFAAGAVFNQETPICPGKNTPTPEMVVPFEKSIQLIGANPVIGGPIQVKVRSIPTYIQVSEEMKSI